MNRAILRAEKALIQCYGWCNLDDFVFGCGRRQFVKRTRRRARRRYGRALCRFSA